MWKSSSFCGSWHFLMNLNFHISFGFFASGTYMFVCLGQVFATFLLSVMTGSEDTGQDFLACDYGTISVHLGRAHFIRIHPHSNVLILYQSTLNSKLLFSATYFCLLVKWTVAKEINTINVCQKDALYIQIVFLGILYKCVIKQVLL